MLFCVTQPSCENRKRTQYTVRPRATFEFMAPCVPRKEALARIFSRIAAQRDSITALRLIAHLDCRHLTRPRFAFRLPWSARRTPGPELPQPHGPGVPLGQFGRMPLQLVQTFEQLVAVPREV